MDDAFIGMIKAIAFNYVPQGWLMCDGRLLDIRQYVALYSLLGTRYGGDGKTTFALPDLRGCTIIGTGASAVSGRLVPTVPIAKATGANTLTVGVNGSAELTVGADNLPATELTGTLDVSALSAVSTLAATTNGPGATAPVPGAMLSASDTGASAAALYYTPPPSTTPSMVALNGVSTVVGGTASFTAQLGKGTPLPRVDQSGNVQLPLMQPALGLLYIICWDGIYLPNPN